MSDNIQFSPLTWHRKMQQGNKPPFSGPSVPCGSCTACCETGRVVLYPAVDDVKSYGTQTDDDGTITLTRHPNGHCLYLHEGTCLIYARRPMVCRLYDCRSLLVADVPHPAKVFAAASEKFEMVYKAPGDEDFAVSAQSKARIAAVQGKTAQQQLQIALLT